jgi:hypothetical protein
MQRLTILVVVALAALTGTASAHQTTTSNGARVTMHVAPNDEPRAGSPATVTVTKVAVPRRATFSSGSCGCRLRVTDSSGSVIADRAMGKRTRVTFPRPGAYKLVYSGSYRRGGKARRFAASFAIRAS